jgi:hypothetical protein
MVTSCEVGLPTVTFPKVRVGELGESSDETAGSPPEDPPLPFEEPPEPGPNRSPQLLAVNIAIKAIASGRGAILGSPLLTMSQFFGRARGREEMDMPLAHRRIVERTTEGKLLDTRTDRGQV